MSKETHIKDHNKEKELFLSRIIISSLIGVILVAVIVIRLVQLQVIEYNLFSEKAQGNRINMRATLPPRGLILDRNGKILAENITAFQLDIIPEQMQESEQALTHLADLNLIKEKDIESINKEIKRTQKFRPITIRSALNDEEISTFAVNRPKFSGVDLQPRLIRHYPFNEYTSHVVGYVGAISQNDLTRLNRSAYDPNEKTGKTGTELFNEINLHGMPGFYQYIANARGREIPLNTSSQNSTLLENKPSIPGSNIYLTIDLDLQILATKLLNKRRGAVVAIDPNNGAILTLVSSPTFNPNIFANNTKISDYKTLQSDTNQPLFNRAVLGTYSPGSTIKPILGLTALQIGATNLTQRHICKGFYSLPGSSHRYRDWLNSGHGSINLHSAISQSCDVFFYEIANEVGIDRMHEYLTQFGLGQKTNIQLIGERAGLIPSKKWKETMFSKREDKEWFPGETVIASIGQGYMLATPLQLAVATAALATRGQRYQANLILATQDPINKEKKYYEPIKLNKIHIDQEKHWEEIISAMHNVMQGSGTAKNVGKGAPYKMAGKSGTVQVISVGQEEEYDQESLDERFQDHALFVSFAPLDNPKIAVAVIVENGNSGSRVAAPIAREIMDKYLKH
ncbi:MAG TPA: penicillin-binding protein 2 [Woeseiaceae bacterium]|nr:penicillin-binding protein 2 [Woeseiaceae bacterium]